MKPVHAVMPLDQLLAEDLSSICDDLATEFASMSGSRLLITGGGGFLGYYLVQSALHWNRASRARLPIQVTVFENNARGTSAWLRQLSADANLRIVNRDVSESLPHDDVEFDYVIHAAGIASPIFYRAHPLRCIDANVQGLRNLLERAVVSSDRGRPLRGMLFFSSSEIYGDPSAEAIPTPETYRGYVSCTGPRACYDESKRFGETLCVTFARHHGVPVKMARPFNNYGPGLKITDGRVIPDFAREILAERDIIMLSDGSPTRTFCYATDAIVGYYKALVHGRAGEPYNIGIEQPEISVRALADLVVESANVLFGYKGVVRMDDSSEADYLVDNPSRRCPDISKARRELAFAPRVLPAEGIRRSLVWYHHNRSADIA